MDVFTPEKRSSVMRSVKAKNTKPELAARQLIHRLGYRFRLHRKDLPGKPDIVFPKYRAVIFVHGCFWHWHGCKRTRMPKSNSEYWRAKIDRNVARDKRTKRELGKLGWRRLVIWECELTDLQKVSRKVQNFLV